MAKGKALALGVSLFLAVLAMAGPTWWVSGPLLALSIFLMCWAIVPLEVEKAASYLPKQWKLPTKLHSLGRFLEKVTNDRTRGLEGLAESISSGDALRLERVNSNEELEAWMGRYDAWVSDTATLIQQEFGSVDNALFLATEGVKAADVLMGSLSPLHNTKRLYLAAHLARLRAIVERAVLS